MRKSKTVKIDDREITLREMRIGDIMEFVGQLEDKNSLPDLKKDLDKFLPKIMDAKMDELIGMAPSELEQLFNAFKEVNEVFLAAARFMGLNEMVGKLKNSFASDFLAISVDKARPDTGEH